MAKSSIYISLYINESIYLYTNLYIFIYIYIYIYIHTYDYTDDGLNPHAENSMGGKGYIQYTYKYMYLSNTLCVQ